MKHTFHSIVNQALRGAAGNSWKLILGFMLVVSVAEAQIDCNTTLGCNDLIQVSLDEGCEAVINPDMMLEDPTYANDAYTVTVIGLDGNPIPNATVDYDQVNQTLEVNVQLNGCAASCWGEITVEDKLPPTITACDDVTVDCDADVTPGAPGVPRPTAFDACSPSFQLDFEYEETIEENPCAADFGTIITRVWTVTDEQGNEASCTQLINIERATITDVMFPPNYDDVDEPAFSCSDNILLLPNGAPDPIVTGRPTGADCSNIQVYYSDIIFDICGASIKVLRQWTVVDWCTGEERLENQIIKIFDNEAPICTAQPDFVFDINTDQGECTGTFEVPAPIVIFECSDWNYIVGYKLRDEDGDPFENPVYDNVTLDPSTGLYTISELPQDTTWIVYTITDACGNQSMCFTEVFVEDDEAPTPVCEGYTVVGLEDAGWADIYAESIDDGSYDNCEIDRFEVRRESTPCGINGDLTFGPKVNFCCEDVDQGYIRVIMRAYDKSGNFNDCIVNVNVQDKINPTIECPSDISINCGQDPTDLSLTGEAEGFDNCSVEITFNDGGGLNDCGLGTVFRNWRATDAGGRSASCTQRITVRDLNPFNASNINWPSDLEVEGCNADGLTPEVLNSFPQLSNTDCSSIAISYEDNKFYGTEDYCIKVLRHWKIIDWCNANPQDPQYFEYTQKIGVFNTQAPTFNNCNDVEAVSQDGDCQEFVEVTANATDDCTVESKLEYSYTIDLNNDGIIDASGNGNTVGRVYESGNHTVRFVVEDECGNTSNCSINIEVIDNKPPTPICLGSVVWVLDAYGQAEIWASDFNLKSFDSCDGEDNLHFSFDPDGQVTALSFDCSDIPNGIAASIPLSMYVFDTDGNSEFCDVVLELQDSQINDACQDQDGDRGVLAGKIITPEHDGILDIEVELMDMQIDEGLMDMTEETGSYAFDAVEYYGEYTIAPHKNDDATNGVSTLDLVMIQRHILGMTTFDSPYKLIAADVNKDEKISSSDLLNLRKLILGIDAEFKNNTSWRFMPASFEMEDPEHPYIFPEKYLIDEFYLSDDAIDFLAIKVGDVNNNAIINLRDQDLASSRGASQYLQIDAQEAQSGSVVQVPVKAGEIMNIIGLQGAIDMNGYQFNGVIAGQLSAVANNFYMEDGTLRFSIAQSEVSEISEGAVLFTLELIAVTNTNTGSLTSNHDILNMEYYDQDLQVHQLDLDINNATGEQEGSYELYQNMPNPFNQVTSISFMMEEGGNATLSVFDVNGVVVYQNKQNFGKGLQTIDVDLSQSNIKSGVLYYQLQAGTYTATKKMIKLD